MTQPVVIQMGQVDFWYIFIGRSYFIKMLMFTKWPGIVIWQR